MKNRKNTKILIIIGSITVALIVLLVASASPSSPTHGVYRLFASPVNLMQEVFSDWGRSVKNGFRLLFNADEVTAEIDKLKQDNAQLENALVENEILQKENAELKGMLDFKEAYSSFDIVGAEVIAGDVSEMFNTFTINCGTSDGVEEGSFVVTSQGLVGVIGTAGPISSKVISIVDEQNKIIVRTLENNEMLRVTGTYDDEGGSFLKIDRILDDTVINEGDVLVTSNSGDVYPYGIKVGIVKEIGTDKSSGTRYAVAMPIVNLRTIDKVFVMTPKKDLSQIVLPEVTPENE